METNSIDDIGLTFKTHNINKYKTVIKDLMLLSIPMFDTFLIISL
tara:strand:+ start:2465 stop:2599 length:135 start_codon:yes stop_codon:yes gene_type:complete